MRNKMRLGDIATLITKGTTPTSVGYTFTDTGVNFVKIESIREDGTFIPDKFAHISDECNTKLKRSQLQENDILFSIAGAIGRTAIVTKDCLPANTNQALAIIRIPQGVIDYRFLLYALQSDAIIEQAEKQKQGVAQLNLSLQNINDFEIPFFTEEEQLTAVEVLSSVDSLLSTRIAQLEQLDELVKSRFIELFGDPVSNPNNYLVKTLQELIDMGYITYHLDGNHGGDYPRSDEFVEFGVPYIGANCIVNGEIDLSMAKYLTVERANKLRKGIAQNEDVLFAHNATVGPTVVLHTTEPKIILSTSLTAYRCNKEKVSPYYLKLFMQSDGFVRQYASEMKQTTRNQVPITVQKKYSFLIPPIDLQNQFAEFVEQTDKSKLAVQQSIAELEELKKSLMQKYFG